MMRIVLIFLLLCTPALAHDPSHPELNEWFNRLASGKGLCCSFADGSAVSDVDWESKDGHYRVRQSLDLQKVGTSLFFLPDIRPGSDVPLMPVLFVGWTLNFEMMFYGIFAVCLLLRGESRLIAVVVAILALWIAHFFSDNSYVRWLGSDIILAFAAGILIWRATPALPLCPAVLLIVVGLAILTLPDSAPQIVMPAHRDLILTIGAGALVLAAVALERAGLHVGKGWLTAQGDASYSLHLLHPLVLQNIGKLAVRTGISESSAGLSLVVVIMFVASVIAGTIFHRLIERPITDLLRRRKVAGPVAIPNRQITFHPDGTCL